MKYEQELYFNIVFFNNLGFTYRKIASTLGIPFETVKTIMRRKRITGSPLPNWENSGRKISQSTKNQIKMIQLAHPTYSLNQIRRELISRSITIRSKTTVLNYKKILGFKRRKISLIPYLKSYHISKRKEWCRLRTEDYWRKTIFCDESSFEMNYSKRGYVNYLNRSELQVSNYYSFQKVYIINM